jgi:hypothetical protein
MKTCFKCKEAKPLTEFYPHPAMSDGRLGKCKVCNKRDVAENYRKRHAQYCSYEQRRFRDPQRKQKQLEYHRKYVARHPDKAHAHRAVQNAIRAGKLLRQPCEVCRTTIKVQAHHHDYSKPLDVRWLCFKHHGPLRLNFGTGLRLG